MTAYVVDTQNITNTYLRGSRIVPYTSTAEADVPGSMLRSISAIPAYAYVSRSHEELRWEDYQLGDRGRFSETIVHQCIN